MLKRIGDHKVIQGRRVEHLQDRRLYTVPDGPRHTYEVARARARQIVLGGAVHWRYFAFEDAIDIADGYRRRAARQPIPSMHATRPLHEARTAQLADQLLEIGKRQVLISSNFRE